MDDVPTSVRIIALADTFDALTSPRPYREPLSVGSTLSEIERLSPLKFDPNAVQGLLLQVRRDAVASNRTPFVEDRISLNIAAPYIDHLSETLLHKIMHSRILLKHACVLR